MSLRLIQKKASDLLDINPQDYDVILSIIEDGQEYRVLKNTYIEYDDFVSYPISEMMKYVMSCYDSYDQVHGNYNVYNDKGLI